MNKRLTVTTTFPDTIMVHNTTCDDFKNGVWTELLVEKLNEHGSIIESVLADIPFALANRRICDGKWLGKSILSVKPLQQQLPPPPPQHTEAEIRADERKIADHWYAQQLEALADKIRDKYRVIQTPAPVLQPVVVETVVPIIQPTPYQQRVAKKIYKYPDYVKEILEMGLTVEQFAEKFERIVESEYEVAQTSEGWGIRNKNTNHIEKKKYDTQDDAATKGISLYKGYRVGHIEQHHPKHWLEMKGCFAGNVLQNL